MKRTRRNLDREETVPVHPASTSYPTLAVIQQFGITDPAVRQAIWRLSDAIAVELRSLPPGFGAVIPTISGYGGAVVDRYGELVAVCANDFDAVAYAVDLEAAQWRALQWCRRDQFIGWIAERYIECGVASLDVAREDAEAALTELGCAYGHPGYDWSRAGARLIADEDMQHWEG